MTSVEFMLEMLPLEVLEMFGFDLETLIHIQRVSKSWYATIKDKPPRIKTQMVFKKRLEAWLHILTNVKVTSNTSETSIFSGVRTLDLSWTNVVDVSALGRVHTLRLIGTKVVDVSALGSVHTLDLSYTEVVDVSALGGVHTLYLHNTRGNW